jgi:methyltransferase family protein
MAAIKDSFRSFDRRYFEVTRRWLDERFAVTADGSYVAHEPIFGIESRAHSEGGHLRRSARIFDALMLAAELEPKSLLDVGGADGFLAALAQRSFGIDALSLDLSAEASGRAMEHCGVPAVAADAAELPFLDDSFDVITITEVLEHLTDPIGALLEARRVARLGVIFSTEEHADNEELRQYILSIRSFEGHGERNIFVSADFESTFAGDAIVLGRQRDPAVDPEVISFDNFCSWLVGEEPKLPLGVIGRAAAHGTPHHPVNDEKRLRLAEHMWQGVATPGVMSDAGSLDARCEEILAPRRSAAAEFRSVESSSGRCVLSTVVDTERNLAQASCRELSPYDLAPEVPPELDRLRSLFSMRPHRAEKVWSGPEIAAKEEGWTLIHCGLVEETPGAIQVTSDDPHLISPYQLLPTTHLDRIEFRIRFPEAVAQECAEVYYQLDGQMMFTSERSLQIPFTCPDGVLELSVPLSSLRSEGDFLVRFRIDPIVGSMSEPIFIDGIRLCGRDVD